MIGQLRGKILEKQPPQILLEVNGVGYEVNASMSTFYKLPDVLQEVTLHTHFIVREDSQQLFGFFDKKERLLFKTLLKVNGVGPRLGLAILSSMNPEEFVSLVVNNDAAGLVQLPGVGKKTAERLIVEMRDKLSAFESEANLKTQHNHISEDTNQSRNFIIKDAVSALVSLGYKPQEASRIVSRVDDGKLSSEEIIRNSLREMVV